jgi:hypothetical protein
MTAAATTSAVRKTSSRWWTNAWQIARVVIAVGLVSAMTVQLVRTIEDAHSRGPVFASHIPTIVVNFFSYFTIESNLAAAILFIVAAAWAWRHGHGAAQEPAWISTLFACVSTYMITTGLVYNLLLRPIENPDTRIGWANELLHVICPLFLLLDALVAPHRRPVPWKVIPAIVSYPLVWAVYTLIRANHVSDPVTGTAWWYPYPFLDPNLQGGFGGVVFYIVAIAIGICVVGAGVIWAFRRRGPVERMDAAG